jgi:hypothetical protein
VHARPGSIVVQPGDQDGEHFPADFHRILADDVLCVAPVDHQHEMQRRKARYGLETMCIGGGQGIAAIFERA